jgi:hypothetical protein
MITPALVHADVVDVRKPGAPAPSDFVVDANVLYWLFYGNFSSLSYAGGRLPFSYQLAEYPKYWRRAATLGAQFHMVAATLGEFAKAVEYADLEAIWLTDPSCPQPDPANPVSQFDPRTCKFARYHYSSQLAMVRKGVETMIASVRKSVGLLADFPTPDDQQDQSMGEWLPSAGDFPDAVMIASAKQQSIAHILSDDMDIATFAGVTLYTANLKTINAASAAGKLR